MQPFILLLAGILIGFLPGQADAHRSRTGPTDGLPIPSLTHGQLAVVADYEKEIRQLASRQPRPDETQMRLGNFVDIQRMACVWGFVPYSLADEASPFNECSHAYLSGTMALLVHLRDREQTAGEASKLLDRVALTMLANETAPLLCAYGGEPYNTADVMAPHWGDIPLHLPSLLFFGGITVLAGGSLRALLAWMARSP